jgi:hypothetical protein
VAVLGEGGPKSPKALWEARSKKKEKKIKIKIKNK